MKSSIITPIFIFSLPRSGSTLLQRILATHPQIATTSEPWLLLPFLSTLRETGTYTDYRHAIALKGIRDFCKVLPNGRADYLAEMRAFITRLYQLAASENSLYFLDKTPHYHLILPQLIELFPEAKFVLLWRNPLAVLASILGLRQHWNIYRFQIDLFDGILNLIDFAQNHSDRICQINYENLVTQPQIELERVFLYLQIPWSVDILSNFTSIQLQGELGDPTGVKRYSSLSHQSLDKWKLVLSNPLRKIWCRRYIHWIGSQKLNIMGYDLESLSQELAALPFSFRHIVSDFINMMYSPVYRFSEPHLMKSKLRKISDLQRIYAHL